MKGPLSGIRILDITSILMGPFASQIIGDLGGDIIKIEPLTGDISRHIGMAKHPGMAGLYMNNNRNKRSLAVDLKRPEALAIIKRLAKTCDVMMTNVRPNGIRRLGLDYEAMRAANPRLIYVSMVGYGSGGRYANKPAYDDLIQAASGIASLHQSAGGSQPRFVPLAMADRMVGMMGANAVLAALVHRAGTGEGQEVEVPMFETMVHCVLGDHLSGATFEPPIGGTGYERLLSPHRAPFATRDGFVAVLPYNDSHWRSFFEAAGRPEVLSEDQRFSNIADRTKNIDALYQLTASILATRTTSDWLDILDKAGVPVMVVHSPETLLTDPHLADVGFFGTIDHPTEGQVRTLGIPTKWSASPPGPISGAPGLGEHSREVLGEVGFGPEEIDKLAADGVILTPEGAQAWDR